MYEKTNKEPRQKQYLLITESAGEDNVTPH
jgi:hypothetical protein